MKSGRRACSPDGFRSFSRGGQAAKPLCPPTTRNAKRSEYGVLNSYYKLRKERKMNKKLILVVSFGTSFHKTRELTIGAIETAAGDAFPDCEVRRAFTSGVIIRALHKQGIHIDTVPEALDRALADGFTDVVIQPTHIIRGIEYEKILREAEPYSSKFSSFSIGDVLLHEERDFELVAEAIAKKMKPYDDGRTAICLMGHGSPAEANRDYMHLQHVFREMGLGHYFVATVEADPNIRNLVADVSAAGIYQHVVLLPLMVVAGDHATNDMAGETADSWKSSFETAGFSAECVMEGLGQMKNIRSLYMNHICAAMSGMLYGVGVGPGDPEEMTLKAVRILKGCGAVALPEPKETCIAYQTALRAVPSLADKPVIEMEIPMTRDEVRLSVAYQEGFAQILPALCAGRDVAFLTIGDVAVYSTFARLGELAEEAGIRVRLVSGVTSFSACAAALGISLTKGRSRLHILPGREASPVEGTEDTEVYMKSGHAMPALKKELIAREKSGEIDVKAVSNCGLPTQIIARSAEEIPDDAAYMTCVIARKLES